MPTTYFVTGAEGAGKSSIIPILKQLLPDMDIHDFDEVGVPLNPGLKWRLDTTLHWIKKAIENQKQNKSTCIVGLSFPNEVREFRESQKLAHIMCCFLDVHEKEREKRLRRRKNESEEVRQDLNQLYQLREQMKEAPYVLHVIDTTNISAKETAKMVIKWIRSDEKEQKQIWVCTVEAFGSAP